MTIQNEPSGARVRSRWATIMYDRSPATEKERADVENFLNWRFPHYKAIKDLQEELGLYREHVEALERGGHSGQTVSMLRAKVTWLESEIERLQTSH